MDQHILGRIIGYIAMVALNSVAIYFLWNGAFGDKVFTLNFHQAVTIAAFVPMFGALLRLGMVE